MFKRVKYTCELVWTGSLATYALVWLLVSYGWMCMCHKIKNQIKKLRV